MGRNTAFGIMAKKALLDKRMEQTELAQIMGISVQNLNHIFSGISNGQKHRPRIIEILELNDYEIKQ